MSWSFTSSSWTLHTKILPCFWTWVMFLYSASLLHKLYEVLASILNSLPHQPSSLLYSKNLLFAQCRVSQEVCGITLLWKMVFSFILRIEEALLWQSYWIVTLDPCFCFNLKDTTCLCLSEALKMQTTKYFSHSGHFLRLVDDPKRFWAWCFCSLLLVSSIWPTSCDGFHLCETRLLYHLHTSFSSSAFFIV